jgi:hypothetical protein
MPPPPNPPHVAYVTEILITHPLLLPALTDFSIVCPGARDRAGLYGFDDWDARPSDGPDARAVTIAYSFAFHLHHRHLAGLPGLASLTLAGWPFGAVGAHPRTLHVLVTTCPGLQTLRLDGGPGPMPDLDLWEGMLAMLPDTADEWVGVHSGGPARPLRGGSGADEWVGVPPAFHPGGSLRPNCAARLCGGRPAFSALRSLELGPGLFWQTGAIFAIAAMMGGLPSLRHLALADASVGAAPAESRMVNARLCAMTAAGVVGGPGPPLPGPRTLRCRSVAAARHAPRESWPCDLVALDLRAAAETEALGPADVPRVTAGSPGLVALALPLGGDGWAERGVAGSALRGLASACPRLASLTLEVWGAVAGAAVLPALGDLLAACPVADLEVSVEMGSGRGRGRREWRHSRLPGRPGAAATPWPWAAWLEGDAQARAHGCGSPQCAALAAALARGRHLRRVCIRRSPLCAATVAALAAAAPRLEALVVVSDAPPALPPALAAHLAARRVRVGTPRSGPPTIPSPMHHIWWPGVGGGVGKTAVSAADARGGAGRGWPAGWLPAVGPPPGAASAGVLWWHTAAVTADGDPDEGGGSGSARVVAGGSALP